MPTPLSGAAAGGLAPIAGAAALGAVLVAGAVAFVTLRDTPADEGDIPPATESVITTTSDGAQPAAAPPVPEPAPDPPPADAPMPPGFDLVRIDGTGSAVIAGQAPAGADVTLSIDGAPVETTQADGGGNFVALLAIPPSDLPRVLSLSAALPGRAPVAGVETVLIAPFSGEAVAAATPPPEPATAEAPPPETAAAPDPALQADRPGLGEVTSAAPTAPGALAPSAPAGEAPDLAQARPDPAPVPDTGTAAPALEDTLDRPAAPAPVAAADPPATAPAAPQPDAVPQAPAILLADDAGVRVMQAPGAPPTAQTAIRLDAITYDTDGAVMLAGRGPVDASVRVLLNNRPINMGEIGPAGQWSLDLPDVDPGTYTLRLDQVAADGTVMRSVETPFLREDPARIRANPMLAAPDASVITVQRGFTLWGIAEANFGDGILYVQIFDQNRDQIIDPDLIFPGQIFALPDLPRGTGAADE